MIQYFIVQNPNDVTYRCIHIANDERDLRNRIIAMEYGGDEYQVYEAIPKAVNVSFQVGDINVPVN